MREHIQNDVSSKNNKIMENNGDDIDFVVVCPDKDGNSFHAPSMADQNEMKMNENSFLHANPEVHKMLQMFNANHNSSKTQKHKSKSEKHLSNFINFGDLSRNTPLTKL